MKAVLIVAALIVSLNLQAQDTLPRVNHIPETRFTIAVEAGPSFSWFHREGPGTGFMAGAAGHYHATGFFSAGLGLYFERKGAGIRSFAPAEDYSKSVDYFTIQPMLGFYAGGKVRFVARVGGFFAVPLRISDGEDISIVPYFDGGILLSGGLDVKIHKLLRLRLENRIALGFGTIVVVNHYFGGDMGSPLEGSFSNSIVLGVDFLIPGSK